MYNTYNNKRRDFLKMIPLAVVSIGAFSIFKNKQTHVKADAMFSTINSDEADDIIKNEDHKTNTKLRPEQPPIAGINIKG